MDKSAAVAVIREQVDAAEALSIVAAAGDVVTFGHARRVHYPYHWFDASGSTPGLFGRRALALYCLVDARCGIASTADVFASEQRVVPGSALLGVNHDADASGDAARRYLAHSLRRRLRTIADFRLSLDYRGLVYKTYWVIDCGNEDILVDSGTGAFHLLQAA